MKHSAIAQRLRQWIAEGRGQGHGAHYSPWLQIARNGSPKSSTLVFTAVPGLGRHGHFLSRNEWDVAVFLTWLGVADLREQYPMWPWPHPHPLYDHPECGTRTLKMSRGTLAIAAELGVAHPWFVGNAVPYVMTTDLLVTVRASGQLSLRAFSVKSADELKNGKLSERAAEKLRIEKQWAAELDIPWRPMSNQEIPATLRSNLQMLAPCADIPDVPLEYPSDRCERYADCLLTHLDIDSALGDTLRLAQRKSGLGADQVRTVFRHLLWHRRLSVDIRQPWVMSVPPKMTGFAWVRVSKRHLLGCGDE